MEPCSFLPQALFLSHSIPLMFRVRFSLLHICLIHSVLSSNRTEFHRNNESTPVHLVNLFQKFRTDLEIQGAVMECIEESLCWSYNFPELPPPPPLPSFLSAEVNAFLNQTKPNVLGFGDCSLCSWAGADAGYEEAKGNPPLPLSSLLVIVAVVSALAGAGLTAAILSFRKLRNRKLQGSVDSMRHLARKINETSRPSPSVPSSFPTNTISSENNYCEGPYFDKDASSNNIYAELHPGAPSTGLWTRAPLPAPPPVHNCYLELKDLPNRCRRCLPPVPTNWPTADASPSHSVYYSDLDLSHRPSQQI